MAMGFLKKGKAAQQLHKAADQKAEAAKAAYEAGTVRRFFIKREDEEEATITFLDGDLDDDGMLDAVTLWEHNLKINGKWGNIHPCTQLQEECPICEGGDNPYLITLFTIIDHREWTDKNGNKHSNERKLFACKREVFKRLQKIAAKRGGLAGCTFEVSRSPSDKSPATGDSFDFVEKRTLKQIAKALGLDAEESVPYDYEEVIEYLNAKQLRKLGFGTPSGAVLGSEGSMGDDDDEDEPKPSKPKPKKKPTAPPPEDDEEEEEEEEAEEEEEEEEAPPPKPKKTAAKKTVKKTPPPSDDDDEEDGEGYADDV